MGIKDRVRILNKSNKQKPQKKRRKKQRQIIDRNQIYYPTYQQHQIIPYSRPKTAPNQINP